MNLPELSAFGIYLGAMLAVGLIFYRKTGDLSDYILGGRKLGSVVAALSVGASDMSGWLLLGLPGAVYAAGFNQIWIAVGLLIGAYLNWRIVAGRLRDQSERAGDALTLPEFFENRFEDRSRSLRVISALIILIFFTVYTSSGLVAGALLFERTLDLNYRVALGIGALVIVSYTFLGGFLAVSWTDFFQGSLMLLALCAVPIIAFLRLGGGESFSPQRLDPLAGMDLIGIVSLLGWGLGYFGQPHILARFMAVRGQSTVPGARRIAMSWMFVTLAGALAVGFLGQIVFVERPLENPETVFIVLTRTLFHPWLSGILLAAILSAIMSTVDSQLLVCSSALGRDFYQAFFRRQAGPREEMAAGRLSVIVIALIAVLLASDRDSRVLEIVAYAWAGFGAAFGPVVILSLVWKNMSRNGALAGMLVGATTVIVWKQIQGGFSISMRSCPVF